MKALPARAPAGRPAARVPAHRPGLRRVPRRAHRSRHRRAARARGAQLEVAPLAPDELVLVTPPGHPLARKRGLSLADLDGEPFIAFDRDIPTRKLIDRAAAPQRRGGALRDGARQHRDDQALGRSGPGRLDPARAGAEERSARAHAGRAPGAGGRVSRPVGAIYVRRRPLSPAARRSWSCYGLAKLTQYRRLSPFCCQACIGFIAEGSAI